MTKSFYPFLIIVFSAFLLMCAPVLFTEGMFMDGLIYSTVARNLAEGDGSFWFLKFTDAHLTTFHEHPPLVFGIQSFFYSLLGDSIYIDRIYSFCTFILSGLIMIFIWNEATEGKFKQISWFPLLLWILMPLVSWAAMNSMLENTMSIFVLASVFFNLKSLKSRRFFFLVLSAVMLCLAFLSKGFTGLFPLALPFFIYCFKNDYSFERMAIDSLVIALSISAFFAILFLLEPKSAESIKAYLQIQVGNSLQNVVTVNTRFYILWVLVLKVIIAFALVVILYFIGKRKIEKDLSWMFVFLSLGFSGVLPIMISLKQNDFYILCALPFFALSFALWVAPIVQRWVEGLKKIKLLAFFSVIMLLSTVAFAFSMKGKFNRDEEVICNVKSISKIIPPRSLIEVSKETFVEWSLQGYFYRYAHISLVLGPPKPTRYYMFARGEKIPNNLVDEKPIISTSRFIIYELPKQF